MAILQAIPWMASARPETVEALARSARIELHPPGAQVGRRGRLSTHFVVVIRGALILGYDLPDGHRHVVNLLGPGQFQALIPLIDERPQIHDSICKGEVELLLIPRAAIVQAIDSDQGLTWEVLRLLCARSRRLYDMLGENHGVALSLRLPRILRDMFIEHGSTLAISQDEIADILGVTRQTVNRELKALEADGVIALGRGQVRLLEREQLMQRCAP